MFQCQGASYPRMCTAMTLCSWCCRSRRSTRHRSSQPPWSLSSLIRVGPFACCIMLWCEGVWCGAAVKLLGLGWRHSKFEPPSQILSPPLPPPHSLCHPPYFFPILGSDLLSPLFSFRVKALSWDKWRPSFLPAAGLSTLNMILRQKKGKIVAKFPPVLGIIGR